MDPRRVLTFRAVAHERSFSAAARALALTQPAVSQQVAALEKEVGARLLDREPGGLQLTRAGRGAARARGRARRALELAETQLAELGGPGRLRIGAFSSALAALVPRGRAARCARATCAGAEVLVLEGDSQALAERVRDRRAASQRRLPGRRADAARARRPRAPRPAARAVPGRPRAGPPLAGRETRRRWASSPSDPWSAASTDGLIARACRAAGFEPRIVSITRDPIAIREFVARGTAVTLVPRLLAPGLDGLAFAAIDGGPERDVYVLLPPGGRHPLVEPTLQALAEVASELA